MNRNYNVKANNPSLSPLKHVYMKSERKVLSPENLLHTRTIIGNEVTETQKQNRTYTIHVRLGTEIRQTLQLTTTDTLRLACKLSSFGTVPPLTPHLTSWLRVSCAKAFQNRLCYVCAGKARLYIARFASLTSTFTFNSQTHTYTHTHTLLLFFNMILHSFLYLF